MKHTNEGNLLVLKGRSPPGIVLYFCLAFLLPCGDDVRISAVIELSWQVHLAHISRFTK
ncbi:hypothetical protein BgiMline_013665, partial [Biomphalaria glabrata]